MAIAAEDGVRDKVFLQSLLSHGAMQEEQIKELHQESARVCEGEFLAVPTLLIERLVISR